MSNDKPHERYVRVTPPDMETLSKSKGFIRFQFQSATGKWKNYITIKNPCTASGLAGEHPPVRAVFETR